MKTKMILCILSLVCSLPCRSQIYCQVQPTLVNYDGWPALFFDESSYSACYSDGINLAGYYNPKDTNTRSIEQVLDITLYTQASFDNDPYAYNCEMGTYYGSTIKSLQEIFCRTFSSFRSNQIWCIVFHYTTQYRCQYSITLKPPYENLLVIQRTLLPVPEPGSLYFGLEGIVKDTIQWGTDPSSIGNTLPSGGDGNFSYQWEYKQDSEGNQWLPIDGAVSQDLDPGILEQSGLYLRTDIPEECGLPMATNAVGIDVLPDVQAGKIQANAACCYGDTLTVTSLQNGSGGIGSYRYAWQQSSDGTNFINLPGQINRALILPDQTASLWIRRSCTSGVNTAYSDTVFVQVYPPVPVPEVGMSNPYCYGTRILLSDTTNTSGTDEWFGLQAKPQFGQTLVIPSVQASMTLLVCKRTPEGCLSDSQKLVLQVLQVLAAYRVSEDTIACGEQVHFINESENASLYDWSFSEGDSSTVASPWHYFNLPGKKTIRLIACQGSCCDTLQKTDQITVLEPDGISQTTSGDISIYPNPVHSILHCQLGTPRSPCRIQVFDVLGNVWLDRQSLTDCSLDLQNLSTGIYLVKISGSFQEKVFKLLKN